jgi:hypothetical protein
MTSRKIATRPGLRSFRSYLIREAMSNMSKSCQRQALSFLVGSFRDRRVVPLNDRGYMLSDMWTSYTLCFPLSLLFLLPLRLVHIVSVQAIVNIIVLLLRGHIVIVLISILAPLVQHRHLLRRNREPILISCTNYLLVFHLDVLE